MLEYKISREVGDNVLLLVIKVLWCSCCLIVPAVPLGLHVSIMICKMAVPFLCEAPLSGKVKVDVLKTKLCRDTVSGLLSFPYEFQGVVYFEKQISESFWRFCLFVCLFLFF